MRLAAVEEPFQWQVVRVDLEPVRGSEQAGVRPALIVSNEAVNTALPVVTVVPLTTRKDARRIYPTEALLPAGTAGLPNESVVIAYQIRTISKGRLLGSYGHLTNETLREAVREALRVHLDLLS
jgi:mRNA interferase MazF